MRRLITVLVVAVATAGGSLWWLHDGDLAEAVAPVLPAWDAATLARNAGLPEGAVSTAPNAESAVSAPETAPASAPAAPAP